MNKLLYFEGVGHPEPDVSAPTINNCRIRTAFHLDNGRAVYLEIISKWLLTGFVDACYYITNDVPNNDCNLHPVILPGSQAIKYTEDSVLRLVNSLGASFNGIIVLPDLGGYHVFPQKHPGLGPTGYYYGDQFQYDPNLVAKRKAVYDRIYDIEKSELLADRAEHGNKFVHSPGDTDCPNFSLWVDEFEPRILHLLRHFNGCNRSWIICLGEGDNLVEAWQEISLGRYGC